MQSTARQELTESLFCYPFFSSFTPHIKKCNFGFGQITETIKSGSRTAEFRGSVKESHACNNKNNVHCHKRTTKNHVKMTTIVVFSEVKSRGRHSLTYDLGAYLMQHGEASLL